MFPSQRRIRWIEWTTFSIVFLTDRVIKESLRYLYPPNLAEKSQPLVSGVLYLYRSENAVGTMGFLYDLPPLAQRILPALLTAIFCVFLMLWIRRLADSEADQAHPLILILSGIAANGIALLLFGQGMKTLTWKVGVSWSFNLADAAVFAGFFWLILQRLKKRCGDSSPEGEILGS